MLAPGRTIDEEKATRNITDLGLLKRADDIKNSYQMPPRLNLKTLSYLIEEVIFCEDARVQAVAIRDSLEEEIEKTNERNLKKKETKKEK